jgi:hypothetical protein
MQLDMGVPFTIAALLALPVWLTAGDWRPFLEEVALLAALATIPVAYRLWGCYVAHHLCLRLYEKEVL